jgi:hypothetical protein
MIFYYNFCYARSSPMATDGVEQEDNLKQDRCLITKTQWTDCVTSLKIILFWRRPASFILATETCKADPVRIASVELKNNGQLTT